LLCYVVDTRIFVTTLLFYIKISNIIEPFLTYFLYNFITRKQIKIQYSTIWKRKTSRIYIYLDITRLLHIRIMRNVINTCLTHTYVNNVCYSLNLS